jgi:RIO kinase 1
VDEELGTLRAGKEAGCFLVRRSNGERWCLLVRKDYRRRSDREYNAPVRAGERGIRRDAYEDAVFINDARVRRAVHNRSTFGRNAREAAWAHHEFEVLRRLWAAGASVPYPVEHAHSAFLMQYVGTLGAAAPRLADLRPDRDEAAVIFDRLLEELRIFVREGVVHADLSEYNVLVLHGRPWLIDVPQAVDLYGHTRGREHFTRDVASLCRYFERRGLACNARDLIAELLEG